MPTPIELLFGPQLKGPLMTEASSSNDQWAGQTAINTAAATATMSTTIVNSDSVILFNIQLATAQASGTRIGMRIKTISSGNYFQVETDDGIKLVTNGVIHWFIMPTS